MAKNRASVLLGYQDDFITDKHTGQINFTTNKIGGKPDSPSNIKVENPPCPLCYLPRPLVLQIYAPLENSTLHRTLYLFACINANCWNRSESWACVRVHSQDPVDSDHLSTSIVSPDTSDWCMGADDWEDDNFVVTEENGNVINERVSDEDESWEEAVSAGLGNLRVDDTNANIGDQATGNAAASSPPTAYLEPAEGDTVTPCSPSPPRCHADLPDLLRVAPAPLPDDPRRIHFVPSFLSVASEEGPAGCDDDRHVGELLRRYGEVESMAVAEGGGDGGGSEGYEEDRPAHGDFMWHRFIERVRWNPGQVMRYGRASEPLLLYPLQDVPKRCEHCQGETTFELQVLSTIIPKLRLATDPRNVARLEFGTVLVFTCRKSCRADLEWKREAVVVQSEVL